MCTFSIIRIEPVEDPWQGNSSVFLVVCKSYPNADLKLQTSNFKDELKAIQAIIIRSEHTCFLIRTFSCGVPNVGRNGFKIVLDSLELQGEAIGDDGVRGKA